MEQKRNLEISFSNLRINYNNLKRKINLQGNQPTPLGTSVQLKLIQEDIDDISERMEEIMVQLDKQGKWTISDEDIKRIEASEKVKDITKELFKKKLYEIKPNTCVLI